MPAAEPTSSPPEQISIDRHDQIAVDIQRPPAPGNTPAGLAGLNEDDASHEEASDLSVGDPVLRKSRLLSKQCATCIFRPGNLMRLSDGRLRNLVAEARRDESFIVCHDTLPYSRYPGVKPAICRGFADRYSTQALQVIERLFGFVEVDPPDHGLDQADNSTPTQDRATGEG